jgi:hypothetical protein
VHPRTRVAVVSSLFALVIPTVVVVLVGPESVARVGDQGGIPRGIPLPHLPDFRLFSFSLVTGALAVAAIVLVQGAGVAEAAPNPGDARPNPDQDIITQGAGNLASGFFRGIPVGGSVGQTALNVSVGARTRWAAVWSGVWLLVILALFSGLVAKIAVPTLGAILIFAAIGSFQPGEIRSILRTGRGSQITVITTFAATLFLPVAAAVGIGVALSLLLQLNQEAMDLAVVELIPLEHGRFEERPAPPALTSYHVTTLDVYGSLMYAGARTLQARLPDPAGTRSPAVVLRLRRRTSLGATFVKVVADYADRLAEVDGRLYLSGLDPSLTDRLRRTGTSMGRCARSRPPRSVVNRPGRPRSMPRRGSSRGTTAADEPAPGSGAPTCGKPAGRCAGPCAGLLCGHRTSLPPGSRTGRKLRSACCARGLQGVQFFRFLRGDQPDLHQVKRADEAVAEAEAPGAGDRVPQRHRPVMLQQEERGRGAVRDVLEDVPAFLLGEHVHAAVGLDLLRSGDRTGLHAFLALDAEADQGTDLAAELDRLGFRQVAEMLDFDFALGVLVDGQRVDHPDHVALAEPFEFGDDLAVEVWLRESQHDELYRPDGHETPPLLSDRLLHPGRGCVTRPTTGASALTGGPRITPEEG